MSKARFIQSVIVRSLPPVEKVEAGVRYAEQVYDELTRLGYGAPKQRKQREQKDGYKALSEYQRTWFDKFWQAFGHKHGRDRAALAWAKLGEPSEADYQQIIDAATAESLRPRKPTESRKMAEGWINERRFEDQLATTKSASAAKNKALKLELISQLNGLKQFNSDGSNDDEIARIEQELKTL